MRKKSNIFNSLGLQAMAVVIGLSACNASRWSDPFTSPPVGQKFFVAADPKSEVMLMSAPPVVTPAVILKISQQSDISSSRSGTSTIGSGKLLHIKSLAFYGSEQAPILYTAENLRLTNSPGHCDAIRSEINDMLTMYPDMMLLCGEEFSRAFSNAGSVVITTEDDVDHQFTSWGIHSPGLGSSQVPIYSISF